MADMADMADITDMADPHRTTAEERAESSPDAETLRIREMSDDFSGWRGWGPYLLDRAWGTVREDYSANGDAWRYLTYDQSRAKAYRWGKDGIAGLSDRYQVLCFAPSFWNGCDPHLKERLFGLTHSQGNHGDEPRAQPCPAARAADALVSQHVELARRSSA